jgi:hypothetical protein
MRLRRSLRAERREHIRRYVIAEAQEPVEKLGKEVHRELRGVGEQPVLAEFEAHGWRESAPLKEPIDERSIEEGSSEPRVLRSDLVPVRESVIVDDGHGQEHPVILGDISVEDQYGREPVRESDRCSGRVGPLASAAPTQVEAGHIRAFPEPQAHVVNVAIDHGLDA